MLGAGKTTYTFSANANILSANFPFSMLPAGGAGMGQAAETESTLVLAENVYVNLPTPFFVHLEGCGLPVYKITISYIGA